MAIPTALSPEPAVSEVEDNVQPPIAPEFAVTEPVIDALVAVRAPELVTLNGAVDAVDEPAKNGYEAGDMPTAVAPDPAVSAVAPIVNPPI